MKIFYFIFIVFYSANAYSMSCGFPPERVIGICDYSKFKDVFYIQYVSSYKRCGRRPEVQDVPKWLVKLLEYEVKFQNLSESLKVYELNIPERFWNENDIPDSFDSYFKIRSLKGDKLNNFRDEMNYDLYEFKFRETELKIIEGISIEKLLLDWHAEETEQYKEHIIKIIKDWGIFIASLILLFFSIKWYHKKMFCCSIGIQFLFFVISFLVNIIWITTIFTLHSIIIPIVWIYEIAYSIRNYIRKKD